MMNRRRNMTGDVTVCFRLVDGSIVSCPAHVKRGKLCETLPALADRARVALPTEVAATAGALEDATGLVVFEPLTCGVTYFVADCRRISDPGQGGTAPTRRLAPDTRVVWCYDEHMLLHDPGTLRSPETPHRLLRAVRALQDAPRAAELLPASLLLPESSGVIQNVDAGQGGGEVGRERMTGCGTCPAQRLPSRMASVDEACTFHTPGVYKSFIECGTALAPLPTDIYCIEQSSSIAARYAMAAVIDASALVLHNTLQARRQLAEASSRGASRVAAQRTATIRRILMESALCGFCLVRPPGHHCTASRPAGFCLVNNVAVAVSRLMVATVQMGGRHAGGRPPRIAIVDLDVHFGEGTASFVDEFDGGMPGAANHPLLYLSLHRYDGGAFYPRDTRAASGYVGRVHKGCICNVAVNTRASDAEHCEEVISDYLFADVTERVFLPALAAFTPDVVMVSLGLDAAYGDPLGHMAVQGGFAWVAQRLKCWCFANDEGGEADRPVGLVFALEGGYNAEAVAQGVVSVAHCLTLPAEDVDAQQYARLHVPQTWFDVRQRHARQQQRDCGECDMKGGLVSGDAAATPIAHESMPEDAVLLQRHHAWCKTVIDEAIAARKTALAL